MSSQVDEAVRVFVSTRPRLLAIAYRILRNRFDAEDTVQDTWFRWQAADRPAVVNPQAFLATTTTRLALNRAQSAWHRREIPAGPWLPEELHPGTGPDLAAERHGAIEHAVQLILANLTPAERAAFVLREAFDYPYERIASLLNTSRANCRQHVRRARQHMASRRSTSAGTATHDRLLGAFLNAAHEGRLGALEQALTPDAAA